MKTDTQIIIALIIFMALYFAFEVKMTYDCRYKGGTWFSREGKCVDVKEIK